MSDEATGESGDRRIRYLGMTLRRRTYLWLQVFALGFCAGGAILCLILQQTYGVMWLRYVAIGFAVVLLAEAVETIVVLRRNRA